MTAAPPLQGGSDARADHAASGRWERPLPTPFVVRWANAMTEARPFALALVLLLGISGLAGAWALGLGSTDDPPSAVILPSVSPSASAAVTASPTPDGSATPRPVEHRYVVRNGDTLREIARELYGDEAKWTVILEANRSVIPDPDNLTVGTSLLIPQEP